MVSKYNQLIDKMYEKSNKDIDEKLLSEEGVKPVKSKNLSLIKSSKSIFSKGVNWFKEFYHSHKVDFKYLLLAIPIIATFFIVREVLHIQSLKREAATHQIQVSFEPGSVVMPPATSFTIWFNSDTGVGFANTLVTFDPSLIKLTSDVSVDPAHLSRIIKITPMAEANSTGKISIIAALDPTKRSTPPSAVFQLATLSFAPVSTNPNVTTSISIDTGNSQIVAMDETVFNISATSASITLNPTSSTPSPTASPVTTLVPTPRPTRDPCLVCFKKACNGVCDKNDRAGCPDCQ